jgi:hypothetical protein
LYAYAHHQRYSDIADFLRRSISSVDAVLLYKALALLMSYDLIGALHLGSQIASIYADWQKGTVSGNIKFGFMMSRT